MKNRFHSLFSCIAVVCMLVMVFAAGCGNTTTSAKDKAAVKSGQTASVGTVKDSDNALHVSMLYVGQADATLIQYKGKTMLIDTGDVDSRDDLVAQLKARNIKTIDAILITHPHGDHMGGMAALFKAFTIKQIYDNGQAANTAMYKNYLKNITNKKIPYKALKKGDVITLGSDVTFTVLSPGTPFTKDNTSGVSESGLTNDNSIVCKMTYGAFSVMFTGDSQKEVETKILQDYQQADLRANVLKVGHHGSKTSSSAGFVAAIKPEQATISCGINNQYKFPHQPTMNTLKNNNVTVYRTDQDGTISIISDGKSYEISKER